MTLYAPESSKELTHVPHRAEYDMWCSRLTSKEVDAIFAELDRRIPGDNWTGTVWEPIHTKAYAGIRLVSCPRCRSSGWH